MAGNIKRKEAERMEVEGTSFGFHQYLFDTRHGVACFKFFVFMNYKCIIAF